MGMFGRCGVLLVATTVLAGTASRGEDTWVDWSATFQAQIRDFDTGVDDDDVTGFFDQYRFTRNKGEDPTIDLSLSEFSLDLLEGEEAGTPRLQLRLHSPTSNLNVSGQTFYQSEYFLNQRAELYARPDGLALDLDYRRLRTEDLRLFNDEGWSDDGTARDDRFYVRRTRVGGELRLRPYEILTGERGALGGILSQIALRGGYEERKGKRQTRSSLSASTSRLDQDVTDAGAGLVFNPAGLFTLALDFDHQRFREDTAPDLLRGTPAVTLAFIPDSDRTTGSVRLNRRFGSRAVVHGGLQVSSLNQEGTRTPSQRYFGLRGNKVLFYSGNLATDVRLAEDWSLNAFFEFENRRNRIEHEPGLFDRSDGTQVYPFLKRVRRMVSGAEAVYRLAARNRVALGVRGEWIDRNLEFPLVCESLPGSDSGICPAYTIIDDDTRSYTVYLRGSLHPVSGLQLSAEAGYRDSPETGYIRDLDDVSYSELRTTYALPVTRPVSASLFGRWERGENGDFELRAPGGTRADRDFDRDRVSVGGTLSASPLDGWTLFGSLYYYQDYQDFDLIFSTTTRPRFARGSGDFVLPPAAELDYRASNTALVLGSTVQFGEHTDASLSYTFTRSNWRIEQDTLTASAIAKPSRVRSDINSFEVGVGHWLRKGLRLGVGYRADNYRDRTPVSEPSRSSSAPAFNLSTWDHTITLDVTLNSDAFQ